MVLVAAGCAVTASTEVKAPLFARMPRPKIGPMLESNSNVPRRSCCWADFGGEGNTSDQWPLDGNVSVVPAAPTGCAFWLRRIYGTVVSLVDAGAANATPVASPLPLLSYG